MKTKAPNAVGNAGVNSVDHSSVSRIARYFQDLSHAWNRFWFHPILPNTLGFIRIATGGMLFYMHLVWGSDLLAFLGPNAWLKGEVVRRIHEGDYTWTYLSFIDSPGLLWGHHVLMLLTAFCLLIGFGTRITAPLAWFLNLMYCHRLTGHLFGLDQVVMMLLMYLMLAPCGAVYSVDAWIRRRRERAGVSSTSWLSAWWLPGPGRSSANQIATRLIQLHLCIIYLFGGMSKLRGEMWWDGSALWYALVNWEYQSIDAVWLGHYPTLLGALAHITIFWETFYCATVWPRFLRPWTLALAFAVHGGIAMGLGMITFGLMMIVANLSFIDPVTLRRLIAKITRRPSSEAA